MAFDFATVLVFTLVAVGFLAGALLVGSWVRPDIPDPEKATVYECGERPIGPAWFKFNPRFYLVALVFVIFDVEVAFMFPVVAIYREWVQAGHGLVAFLEIFAFVGILSVALAYVWASGDLAWVKNTIADINSRTDADDAAKLKKAA
ncbi:MAG: NADH-quinone oxidoreductase subunit A [Deltaproteobacteria bacterium]|nr:NADH-quinone oxidoreductase subunit A [Deltaproteobacteria bacterium]